MKNKAEQDAAAARELAKVGKRLSDYPWPGDPLQDPPRRLARSRHFGSCCGEPRPAPQQQCPKCKEWVNKLWQHKLYCDLI
jgi:hypothetical protein